MTNSRIALGKIGEDKTVSFLEKQGFKIIERNYRCCYGEIDIIAKEKETFVFIEVKTRKNSAFGAPQMAVNAKKQVQISKAAAHYITHKKIKNTALRFDVVAVNFEHDKVNIEHIKNAFEVCF